MKRALTPVIALLCLLASALAADVDSAVVSGEGVLRQPIPERVVVLTFDDASSTHARS